MISVNGKDMYYEYGCRAQFWKNETATMFFLKKPSLVFTVTYIIFFCNSVCYKLYMHLMLCNSFR